MFLYISYSSIIQFAAVSQVYYHYMIQCAIGSLKYATISQVYYHYMIQCAIGSLEYAVVFQVYVDAKDILIQ